MPMTAIEQQAHSQELSQRVSCAIESFKTTLFGDALSSESSRKTLQDCSNKKATEKSLFALPKIDIIQEAKSTPESQIDLEKSTRVLAQIVGEKRMAACLSRLSKLTPEKRANFLHTVGAILADTSSQNFENQKTLAKEVIDQVSHTEKIKQGQKGTCGLASVEIDIAASRPDVYARSVYQWSKLIDYGTGERGNDFANISHDPTMVVDRDDPTHQRSLVSRIFQTGAANLLLSSQNSRYESFRPADAPEIKAPGGSFKPEHDTGERVIDARGKVLTWSGVTADDQVRLLNTLTGDNFTTDKLMAGSPRELMTKLGAQFSSEKTPVNVPLHFVQGGHAITILRLDDNKKSPGVFYLNTAGEKQSVMKMSAQQLFDTAMDGSQVVRIGEPANIDGMTYRKPYKLPANPDSYLSIVHKRDDFLKD